MKARYKLDYLKKNPPPPPPPHRPTCAYANHLRKMPPLCHNPNGSEHFNISHSEVVRFIIHAMGGKIHRQPDWCAGVDVFNQGRKNRVIVYIHASGTWQGCDYDPSERRRSIRHWERLAKRRSQHQK